MITRSARLLEQEAVREESRKRGRCVRCKGCVAHDLECPYEQEYEAEARHAVHHQQDERLQRPFSPRD